MQDATPLTLGQEFSGYVGCSTTPSNASNKALTGVYRLALGGTAVGTGLNAAPNFDVDVAKEIANLTGLPFVTAPNKFTVQGAHDALVQLHGTFKTLAVSFVQDGQRHRLPVLRAALRPRELNIPANEPGLVHHARQGRNPTQCEALAMLAAQVMGNDAAVTIGGGAGYLEMNVYKPLMIFNIAKSARLLTDGCHNFRIFLVEGTQPNGGSASSSNAR